MRGRLVCARAVFPYTQRMQKYSRELHKKRCTIWYPRLYILLCGLTNSPTSCPWEGSAVGLEPTTHRMGEKVCLLCQLWESNPPSPARTLVLSPVHATDRVGSSQPLIPASALPRVRDLLLVVGVPCFPHPVIVLYYKRGQMSIPFLKKVKKKWAGHSPSSESACASQ